MSDPDNSAPIGENDIAIIGMAAHLPGADGLDAYWQMLVAGSSAIRKLTPEELIAAGEDPAHITRPDYVPYAAPLEGFADFDPEFFGLSPKEAAIMDPQHRQFLEVSWEALENAGHMPEHFPGPIGVFAGCGMGSYFYFNICSNPDLVNDVGMFLLRHTGNDKDFLTTRLSHILDLKGPSVNVQTACSTSLVAVHYAVQALLNGECDMAIAGGVTLEIPQKRGYIYKKGEVLSPDGACHAFDHRAQGTVFGSGAGAVVLRRAADALADGDHVWAIIKGSAVNNDGADKAGYLAPSVGGQAQAVADALALAEVGADTIGYVECHGTGTYLGDPIEVAALTQAFRETTRKTGFCQIGSVKTNIGHLDTAAGAASLIKTALALKNSQIPASLGYEKPNPAIDFDGSPFRVNDRLSDWPDTGGPRRAGVNSLGVGGTNAHVVLEEAPAPAPAEQSDWPFQLLTLSARSRPALEAQAERLAAHLAAHPEQDLADIAWTLHRGRRAFDHRMVLVAESHEQAATLLAEADPRRVFTHQVLPGRTEVAFMFPGGGAQYVGMARDLYETEPVFADWMDRGLDILANHVNEDIRALWLPDGGSEVARRADERLKQPGLQLPLVMIVEYALAQLWISWGVTPAALVGHSMGENTAACLAGVMDFADCIGLVALRGRLMDSVPAGGMLSVPLPADELRPYLGDTLDLAAENAPGLSVASGAQAALEALEARLADAGIEARRIAIDIAAHSRLLDPILGEFRTYLQGIDLHPPRIPVISNRTGVALTAAQATDPEYWVEHLRGMVRFADCITDLARAPGRMLVEMGPGRTLSSLAQAHPDIRPNQVIAALRHPDDAVADDAFFIAALGRLWALGADFDWSQIWGEARRKRVVLPGYPFQRARFYIEPGEEATQRTPARPMRQPDMADWGYAPVWKKVYADSPADPEAALAQAEALNWLVFVDEAGLGAEVAGRLRAAGQDVVTVRVGDGFARDGTDSYFLPPEQGRAGYDALIGDLVARGRAPTRIAHFWLVTEGTDFRPGSSPFHRNLEQGFFSLLFLAQAIADEALPTPIHITMFTTGAARVFSEILSCPEKATIAGPARVIGREMPGVTVSTLDMDAPGAALPEVMEELAARPANLSAALRGGRRFELGFDRAPLPDRLPEIAPASTWMITGGFGGIGQTIAAELIRRYQARIILVSRRPLPPRADWPRATGPDARRIAQVQALEELGGQVEVIAADVSNIQDMRAARAAAEARFGRVTGVIHGAGVIADAPLATKTIAQIEDVFTPKIHGLQVLDQVFPDGSLDWMVLFSSTSTATAPAGQVDYVAANEYLNAFAQARTGGKTRVLALNWGIWADRGMAAEALTPPSGDGPARPVDTPLFQASLLDARGDRVFTGALSTGDWVIGEHRLADGRALLPGTGALELIAQALAAQGEAMPFEIRDLSFLRPLAVAEDAPRPIRLRLARSAAGYGVELRAGHDLPDGRQGFALSAEAELRLAAPAPPPPLDLAAIRARCPQMDEAPAGAALPSAQQAHLAFGPRWQVLRRTALGDGEGLADLALAPEFHGDIADGTQGYALHPALMDIATGWAMALIPGYRGQHLWVPVSYQRVTVYRPLPAAIRAWVRLAAHEPGSPYAGFDVTICAPDGTICAEVEGFSIRRLDGALDLGLDSIPAEAELDFPNAPPDPTAVPAGQERLRHNLGQGIPAAQGGEAFLRALAAGPGQIYVSSMELPALIAQAEAEAAQTAATPRSFDRPALEQDFVAPDGALEQALAGFWQELLGIDRIGALDSFFDLGGHSLIAVRLFARIRKSWGVDLPISTLFEAPNLRKLAALLHEAGVDAGAEPGSQAGAGGAGTPTSRPRRFTHLVPMHDGEGGERTPFFLVAGMFGNVLNLRHLAHLLGADRPFYGLQAKGLLGDDAPHDSVPEAARSMIAEIRQIQPHGPYLLGGFSGGGITAWEIAQQLEAAGEQVALVALLDTPLPQRRPLSRRDRALIQIQELRRQGPAYPFRWATRRLRWEIARRRARPDAGPNVGPDNAQAAPQFHNAAIEAAFLTAVARYRLRPWSGNMVLFRPPLVGKWRVSGGRWVDHQRAYLFEDNDWGGYAPNLHVHEVPGDHDSMVLEPNVRVLAALLRREIEAAEAPSSEQSQAARDAQKGPDTSRAEAAE